MRLIDADAEIARIEHEIQRIDEQIEKYENLIEKEPLNTIHNFANKLEQCYKNKAHCKAEIATLKSYATAYDVDKVVEQFERMRDTTVHNIELNSQGDVYEEMLEAKRHYQMIIQTAKSGGIE